MAFDEVQFDVNISKGAKGGPMFSTVVITAGSGAEQRIGQWNVGRRRWDVSQGMRNPTDMFAIMAFFVNRQGKLRGFRFKDWSDYTTDQPTVGALYATNQLTTTTFQLQKTYSDGLLTYTRTILKPVAGTVKIYSLSTQVLSGWSVDTTTGIVTFTSAPGYVPNASFQFDTPCRFDTDQMDMEQVDVGIRNWSQIPIIELEGAQ